MVNVNSGPDRVAISETQGGMAHGLVRKWRQDDLPLDGVQDDFPKLLQHPLQHRLLADLGKQHQAEKTEKKHTLTHKSSAVAT